MPKDLFNPVVLKHKIVAVKLTSLMLSSVTYNFWIKKYMSHKDAVRELYSPDWRLMNKVRFEPIKGLRFRTVSYFLCIVEADDAVHHVLWYKPLFVTVPFIRSKTLK